MDQQPQTAAICSVGGPPGQLLQDGSISHDGDHFDWQNNGVGPPAMGPPQPRTDSSFRATPHISQALTPHVDLSAAGSSDALPSMPPVRTRMPAAQASAAEEVDLTGDSPVVPPPHLHRGEGVSMPQHLEDAGAEEWGPQRCRPGVSRGGFCGTGRRRRWAAACCKEGVCRGLQARRCCCKGALGVATSQRSAAHLECWLPRIAFISCYTAAWCTKALLGATASVAGPPQPDARWVSIKGCQLALA